MLSLVIIEFYVCCKLPVLQQFYICFTLGGAGLYKLKPTPPKISLICETTHLVC